MVIQTRVKTADSQATSKPPQHVVICSLCDRGNIYCGSMCSVQSRILNHRIANQKYQRSLKGRLKHAQRQRQYRERKKATAKKVTDAGSPVLPPDDVLPARPDERPSRQISTAHCHFCGERASLFLRSGFLRHYVTDVSSSWPLAP